MIRTVNEWQKRIDALRISGQLLACELRIAELRKRYAVFGEGHKIVGNVSDGSGGKGRGMWIGDSRINPTWGAEQREFITNRNAAYKVGKSKYNSKRKIFEVEIEMIAVNTGSRHDYS